MSTHVKVELVDVYAEDTYDPGFFNPDEFFIESNIATTESGDYGKHKTTPTLSISSSEKPPKTYSYLDSLLFNDIVPSDTELIIEIKGFDGPDLGYQVNAGVTWNWINFGITPTGERPFQLGFYTPEQPVRVSELPLGKTLFTIDDFQEPDNCFFGFCDNSGWDYTVRYSITKWENDNLLGTPSRDTFVLDDDYVGGGDYDYAVIGGFDTENDVIQLHGEISDYELENTPLGVNIFYGSGDNQDLIGFVEDVDASELIFGTNLEVDFV